MTNGVPSPPCHVGKHTGEERENVLHLGWNVHIKREIYYYVPSRTERVSEQRWRSAHEQVNENAHGEDYWERWGSKNLTYIHPPPPTCTSTNTPLRYVECPKLELDGLACNTTNPECNTCPNIVHCRCQKWTTGMPLPVDDIGCRHMAGFKKKKKNSISPLTGHSMHAH